MTFNQIPTDAPTATASTPSRPMSKKFTATFRRKVATVQTSARFSACRNEGQPNEELSDAEAYERNRVDSKNRGSRRCRLAAERAVFEEDRDYLTIETHEKSRDRDAHAQDQEKASANCVSQRTSV